VKGGRSGRNGGGRGRSGRSGGMHRRRRHALEALECIGSARRWTELMELAVKTKCRRWSNSQNLLGQNGTRLGLLLLLVGPNGDGFGGQAFMEHYTAAVQNRQIPHGKLMRPPPLHLGSSFPPPNLERSFRLVVVTTTSPTHTELAL
jgi:hypothetical protein